MKKRNIFLFLTAIIFLENKSFSAKETEKIEIQENKKQSGFDQNISNEILSEIIAQLKSEKMMEADFLRAIKILLSKKSEVEFIKNAFEDDLFKKVLREKIQSFCQVGLRVNVKHFLKYILSDEVHVDVAKIVMNGFDLNLVKQKYCHFGNHDELIKDVLCQKNNVELAKFFIKNNNWNEYKKNKDFFQIEKTLLIIGSILHKESNSDLSEIFFKSIEWGEDFISISPKELNKVLTGEDLNLHSLEIVREILKLADWKKKIQKSKFYINKFSNRDSVLKKILLNNGPLLELLLEGLDLNHCFVGEKFYRGYTNDLLQSLIYVQSKELVEQLCSRIQFLNGDIPKIWNLCVKKLDYLKKNQFKDADTTGILSLLLDQAFVNFENIYKNEDMILDESLLKSYENKILIALSLIAHSDFVYAKKVFDQLNTNESRVFKVFKTNTSKILEHFVNSNKEDTVEYCLKKLNFNKLNEFFDLNRNRLTSSSPIKETSSMVLKHLVCAKNRASIREISQLNFWRFIPDAD
ncbi:hypothetical protein, partial [Holospora obtusa]|uniref:hypothetical protein n=1 Tax=Holospora obtusa TaxID=49893 RepID=UPI00058B479F